MAFDSSHAYNVNYGAYQGRGLLDYQGSLGDTPGDTHDGDATDIRKRQEARDEAFKAEKARLKEQLRYALEGPAVEDVAEELAEIALPQQDDAQLRAPHELIDLDRLMQRLELRYRIEEMAAARRREEDDEDDLLLLH